MRKTLLAVAILSGALAIAQAPANTKAPTDQDLLITAAQMDAILENAPVSKNTGKPGSVSAQLFNGGAGGSSSFSTAFIRLDEPDKPHIHGEVNEVYIMKEGSATITTGGTMLGPFTSGGVHHAIFANGPGQPQNQSQPQPEIDYSKMPDRGGSAIQGGHDQQVNAGDVVYIPAGLPHTWSAVQKPIVYWDIKFPKTQ
jgi:mannose-6-phosphate isomerase-like protein (cupin superfamily)